MIWQEIWEVRRGKRTEAVRAVKRQMAYRMWRYVASTDRRASTPDPTARSRVAYADDRRWPWVMRGSRQPASSQCYVAQRDPGSNGVRRVPTHLKQAGNRPATAAPRISAIRVAVAGRRLTAPPHDPRPSSSSPTSVRKDCETCLGAVRARLARPARRRSRRQ